MRSCLPIVLLALAAALAACDDPKPRRSSSADAAPAEPVVITAADVIGRWVIDPASARDAAYNAARNEARRAGVTLSDAELEARADRIAAIRDRTPPSYVFAAGGSFTATGGNMTVDGTWTLDGDTLTLVSPAAEKPIKFTVSVGALTSVSENPDARPIRMIRH